MNKPQISFAKVLWPLDDDLDLLKVRTERRFHKNIAQAAEAIADEDAFLPPKAWLVPDSPDHVEVWFYTLRGMLEVGYLNPRVAKVFTQQLRMLGLAGKPIEVTGCLIGGLTTKEPTVHVNLPADFDLLVEAGYHKAPAHQPAWLSDGQPVRKRPTANFTPDELRKIFCWAGRREQWNYLPDCVEKNVARWNGDEHALVAAAIRMFGLRRE